MSKDEWCSPTRELAEPKLLELVRRSRKSTDSEVILLERRRHRTSEISVADDCAQIRETVTARGSHEMHRISVTTRTAEPSEQVARELATVAAAREAAARRRRGSWAPPITRSPRNVRRSVHVVYWLLLLAAIGAGAAHFTHFYRFTL